MAIAKVTNVELKRNEATQVIDAVAVNVSEGASVDYTGKSCGKILLLISNANSGAPKKATIVAGNSLQGVEDLVISIPQQKEVALVVESGKFMNVAGANKGKVVIKGESADIKVKAIELP